MTLLDEHPVRVIEYGPGGVASADGLEWVEAKDRAFVATDCTCWHDFDEHLRDGCGYDRVLVGVCSCQHVGSFGCCHGLADDCPCSCACEGQKKGMRWPDECGPCEHSGDLGCCRGREDGCGCTLHFEAPDRCPCPAHWEVTDGWEGGEVRPDRCKFCRVLIAQHGDNCVLPPPTPPAVSYAMLGSGYWLTEKADRHRAPLPELREKTSPTEWRQLNRPILDYSELPTPEQITAQDAREATARVRQLVADFSWVTPHDEANYLGMLLTPHLLGLAPAPYKLCVIDAHQRGSGKTFLAQIPITLNGGTLRSWPTTEEELKKQITSIMQAGNQRVVVFDNVRGLVRSVSLEALLTTDTWADRVLGSTNNSVFTNNLVMIMTANNLIAGGDLDRRTLWVRIDPGIERPEERPASAFAIPDLLNHVKKYKVAINGDLMMMVCWWIKQGRPLGEQSVTADHYGRWVATVRGILKVCGVPGVFDHVESRKAEGDPDHEQAAVFLAAIQAIHKDKPWTVKDLTDRMHKGHFTDYDNGQGKDLSDAIPDAAWGKGWRPGDPFERLSKGLGYWLRYREGQWFGGISIKKVGRSHHVGTKYVIVEQPRGDDAAERGR